MLMHGEKKHNKLAAKKKKVQSLFVLKTSKANARRETIANFELNHAIVSFLSINQID